MISKLALPSPSTPQRRVLPPGRAGHGLAFKLTALAAATLMSAAGQVVAQAPGGAAPAPAVVHIPAQPLPRALAEFARQTGLQLVYAPELVAGHQSAGATVGGGGGSADAATLLAGLLRGTGLQARQLGQTWVIERAPEPPPTSDAALPVVRVRSGQAQESATGPVFGYVARRASSGSKTDTSILETPQSLSVLTRDELEARGVADVTEALRYVPGVVVDQYGPDSRGQDWLNLRGFSGYATSLYLDGLAMATNSSFANQRSEPYGLERIEVLRGPTSALYGQADAGGIVNRISKRPRADALQEIEAQLGNANRRQVGADLGGRLDDRGDLLFRLVGRALQTDTQERYSNGDVGTNRRDYLAPSLTWRALPDTTLTLLTEFKRDRNRGYSFYYTEPVPPVGRITDLLVGEPGFNRFDQDQASVGYQFEQRLNDAWTLRQNARVAEVKVVYDRVASGALQADGRTLARSATIFQEKTRQVVVDTQLQGGLRTGPVRHQLLLGLDASRRDLSFLRHSGSAPDLDTLAPVYGRPFAPPALLSDDSRQKLRQTGLYAQDQMHLDPRWLLTLGGRMDWASLRASDALAATAQRQDDRAFSGRAGLTYRMDSGWAPYVSYAASFMPQAGRDFNGAAFRPVRGRQYELGVKFAPEGGAGLFTAAVFDLTKTNVLTTDPLHIEYYVQTGEVRSRGLELEGKFTPLRGLSITANSTWNRVKVTRSNDVDQGRVPTNVPSRTASAWLDYMLPDGVLRGMGFGAGVRHVGSTFDDAQNTVSTPAFTLYDAALYYDDGAWRFALNGNNLADKRYVATCSSGCLWGSRRSVVLSAKRRF